MLEKSFGGALEEVLSRIFQTLDQKTELFLVSYMVESDLGNGLKEPDRETSRTEFGQQMRSLANCLRTCL